MYLQNPNSIIKTYDTRSSFVTFYTPNKTMFKIQLCFHRVCPKDGKNLMCWCNKLCYPCGWGKLNFMHSQKLPASKKLYGCPRSISRKGSVARNSNSRNLSLKRDGRKVLETWKLMKTTADGVRIFI